MVFNGLVKYYKIVKQIIKNKNKLKYLIIRIH